MMSNKSLSREHLKNATDEWATRVKEVEWMVSLVRNKLKGKIVYCNCDGIESNFVKYLVSNINILGIKKVIATQKRSKFGQYFSFNYKGETVKRKLKGDGSFYSQECENIARNCDYIITNPPFSKAIRFLEFVNKVNKDFIFISSLSSLLTKLFFKNIKEVKIYAKSIGCAKFTNNGNMKTINNTVFVCNSEIREEMTFNARVKDIELSIYDEYNAINIDRIKYIPLDYSGEIGVPLTILTYNIGKYFDIVTNARLKLNGKFKFRRVIIKRKY